MDMEKVFLLLILFPPPPSQAKQPFVQLSVYTAYGFPYQYQQDGKQFVSNTFLSLPYAQAPVGELRLERPRPLPADPQRVVNSSELPAGCLAQEDVGSQLSPISEDCLFLNVIAPSTSPSHNTKYPVLVYIHGGGFSYGMSRTDGWQQFTRHFNSRGVVVVSLQYRLAFWGFFSLDTDSGEAGNYGLWDQTAALQFVNQHISSFGGDPTKVTVYGGSAGSASIHSLSLSPHSNVYFQQTIQSSGSLYNPWSHSSKTIERSQNISQQLGCYFPRRVQLTKKCLKKANTSQIWDVLKGWGRQRNAMDLLFWGPVLDQDFFVGKRISQLTLESPIRNTLYGFSKGDGLAVTLSSGKANLFASPGLTVEQQANFTKADLYNHVENYLSSKEVAGPNHAQIKQLLLDYYTRGSNASSLPAKFWYTRFTDAQTDGEFAGGQIAEIGDKIKLNWKQYVYLFDYVHPSHRPLLGIDPTYTPHGYEFQYLMDNQPYLSFQKNETNAVELAFTEKIVNAFASFVKTGNPSSPTVPWPPVDDHFQTEYLRVGEQVVAENTHFTEMAKIWIKVYRLGYAQKISPL